MSTGTWEKGIGKREKMNDRMFLFFYKYIKIAKDMNLTLEETKTFYYMVINYGIYGRKIAQGTNPKLNTLFELAKEHIKRTNNSYEVVKKDNW